MTEEDAYRADTQPPTAAAVPPVVRFAVVGEPPRTAPRSPDEVAARRGPDVDAGRYELLGEPREGGEGFTWHARHTTSDGGDAVRLAVKQLRRPAGAPPSWPSPDELGRLNSHRIVLTSLRSRHLVPVIDEFFAPPAADVVDGGSAGGVVPYVVMPWIDGPSLAEHLRGSPVTAATLAERLALVVDLAEAVSALHSKTSVGGAPLVHRDVKPHNCILSPESGLILVDVSSLRSVVDGYDPAGMRTPAYAAPEVLRDPHAARLPSSDVYSVGAVAYFCLTGGHPPPSPEETRAGLTAAVTGLPGGARLVPHLLSAVDPEPSARPADVLTWARELYRLATVEPRTRRRRRRLAAGLTALALAAASGGGLVLSDRLDADRASADRPLSKNSAVVRITSPAPGARVPQCQEINGVSDLPPGTTLTTTIRNLSSGDPHEYPEPVVDWQTPSRLQAWHGLQYFGQVGNSVGQTYEVRVYSVPLAQLRAESSAANESGELWWFTSVPAGWRLEAWIILRRGSGASVC